MLKKSLFVFVTVLALTACQEKHVVTTPSMALFAEQETNVDPYQTRIIVDKNYMRMDGRTDGFEKTLVRF